MNSDRTKIGTKMLSVALLFNVLLLSGLGSSQDKISAPRKFDDFEDMKTDDIQAHLDLFAQQLTKDRSVRGLIVGYRREDWRPGSHLRYLHGFRNYLVNSLAVAPEQAEVVERGIRDKTLTELWLIPSGASLPNGSQDETQGLDTLTQFDQLTFGLGCESEYTIVLEQPSDAVRFFAEALRRNPTNKGTILVHPSHRSPLIKSANLAAEIKESLIKKYGIASDRVGTSLESRRHCVEIDFWLAPLNLLIPKGSNVGPFFNAQLMAEAERNRYTVRRITLLGNTYTRDNVIRGRLLQNEGDIFRRELLVQSLRRVSKLRNFSAVGIQDVEVKLNKAEKTIDFLILLIERTGSRRR